MPGTRPGMTEIVAPIFDSLLHPGSEFVSEQNATNVISTIAINYESFTTAVLHQTRRSGTND
jgi:hypothetical protein